MKSLTLAVAVLVAVSVDASILLCKEGRFQCENKAACVPHEYVCDDRNDCLDGSDETGCSNGKFCKMKQCEQTCVEETPFSSRSGNFMYIYDKLPPPREPMTRCTCKEGYNLGIDEKTCDDINECALGTHNCTQLCVNHVGTFQCACAEGYYLDQSSHVCRASGVFPLLFVAKPHSIQIHNLVKNKTYHVNIRNAIKGYLEKAVYSPYNKRIIILESFPEGGRILISDRLRVLKTLSLDYLFSGPEDLEIDWRTNNIYITDPSKGVIVACRLDLTCSVVVNEKLSRPTRIVLDPIAGKMYWSDQGVNTGIFSSNMDGENIEQLVTVGTYKPTAIALDKPTDSVFWSDTDGTSYRIQGISLSEKRIWRVLTTSSRLVLNSPINDLNVFEDTVYFSTVSTVVFSFPKMNTPEQNLNTPLPIPKPQVATDRFERISSFSIYQPLLMPYDKFSNPCNKSNCTEMCLLSSENGFSCHLFVKTDTVKLETTVDKDSHATTQGTELLTSSFEENDEDLETDTI